ncbi:hypothetical protein PCC79_13845 [Propioniciclava soli]|uniref:Uncharacterized protein n=1 Tax=Propioniciclava soli TaxID=2775081 RepID=A0ABZ3C6R8_9ACTN
MTGQACVVMVVVVVVEEGGEPGLGLVDGVEPAGVGEVVLHGFEDGFSERVVVGHSGPGVGRGDVQQPEHVGEGAGTHRGAVVGVDDRRNAVLVGERLLEHVFGQVGPFVVFDPVRDHVAGVQIDRDIQLEPDPSRALHVGDVPTPHLPGRGRVQAWRMTPAPDTGPGPLSTTIGGLPGSPHDPVHRGQRAQVLPAIEQMVEPFPDRHVGHVLSVQPSHDSFSLGRGEPLGIVPLRVRHHHPTSRVRVAIPIQRGPRHPEPATCLDHAHPNPFEGRGGIEGKLEVSESASHAGRPGTGGGSGWVWF